MAGRGTYLPTIDIRSTSRRRMAKLRKAVCIQYTCRKIPKRSRSAMSNSDFLPFDNMHRRLLSTPTTTSKLSIAPSTIPRFPPRESHPPPKDSFAFERDSFDATSWASLQPPPATALSAFAHRIGLGSIFSSPDVIRQACTHHSYLHLFRKHHPNKTDPLTNRQLAVLGNALMGMVAVEWVHARWPYLPTRVMKSVVTAHVGPATCESVAREMGAASLLRWHRTVCYLVHLILAFFFDKECIP
jgi:large subunit ribosomal protein L44